MQGFYKNDNGYLVWSEDRVINDNFELWLDKKDTYNYPVEGWIWAENEREARIVLECFGPQPYPSWTLNRTTAEWEAPVPLPKTGKLYTWDEETLSWEEVAP